MSKYRMLTDKEREIAKRNGIDPKDMVVSLRSESAIYLLNHKTRDEIAIYQGDKKWS